MRFNKHGESESFFVSLLYAQDQASARSGDTSKVTTQIDVTRDPLQDAVDHNQGTARHRFSGKNSGTPCKIQQIIGPIDTLEEAQNIQDAWKVNSRGLVGRGAEGRLLATAFQRPIFDAHCDRTYDKVSRRAPRKRAEVPTNGAQ